jgi:hypothetical protein
MEDYDLIKRISNINNSDQETITCPNCGCSNIKPKDSTESNNYQQYKPGTFIFKSATCVLCSCVFLIQG